MKNKLVFSNLIFVFLIAGVFGLKLVKNKQLLIPINTNSQGPQQSKINFLVFGDSGTGSDAQRKLADIMLDYQFDFILHTGDIAYPNGARQEYQKYFFDIYKKHLQKGKIYTTPGNHDYIADNLKTYLSLFNLPHMVLNSTDDGKYYSFDKDEVHFVSLDSNTPLDEISDRRTDNMTVWLGKDLQQAKDKKWKIVFFHHPPYSSGSEHGNDLRVQKYLVPIFEHYGVNVVFSGHDHDYERTCLLLKGTCNLNGILYIVTGGGGGPLYDFADPATFTQKRMKEYHFINVSVTGCKLEGHVIDIHNEIIDYFDIDKCPK